MSVYKAFSCALGTVRGGEPGVLPCRHALPCGTPLGGWLRPGRRAIGSAGQRLVHTEEVTGSIPVSPTTGCSPVACRLPSGCSDSRTHRRWLVRANGRNWEINFLLATSLFEDPAAGLHEDASAIR